jgi:hypothetical protein
MVRVEWADAPGFQGSSDGTGAELAEVALVLQLASEGQHEILQVLGRAIDRQTTTRRPGREGDAVKPLGAGAGDPEPDGGQSDVEASCDLAEGGGRVGRRQPSHDDDPRLGF